MRQSPWSSDRKRLERELQASVYRILLINFRDRCESVQDVGTWLDVEKVILGGSRDDPLNDQILLTILVALHQDKRSEWRSVLLLLFWRDLIWIWRLHERLDNDESARWANGLWAFSETICCFDPTQRRERITQKIRNDTIHQVKRNYSSQLSRMSRFVSLEPEEDSDEGEARELVSPEDFDWTEMVRRQEERDGVRVLEILAARGDITNRDLPLLIGTCIYGETLDSCAREEGISKAAAKKRRQRALASIRRNLKDLEEI